MSARPLSILFVGETNIVHMIEHKGLDNFQLTRYTEYASIIGGVFESLGHSFTHIPCHLVHESFPRTAEGIARYDVVILSDVGSNTMLLHPEYLARTSNPLTLIRDYVRDGGGFAMIGGYLSFQGFDAKARYAGTAIEEVLPVTLRRHDDRAERPEGIELRLTAEGTRFFDGLPAQWPHIFGYNEVDAKPDATVLVRSADESPIIAVGEYGAGRAMAYTTDCVQDWASPELLEWTAYPALWDRLLHWAAGGARVASARLAQ